MATTVTAAGVSFHVDEVVRGGVTAHAQIAKLGFGEDGSYTADVSRAAPLPVDAALRSDVIQNNGSQLVPKFATVTLTADGNILAAQTGKTRVLAMTINCDTVNEDVNIEDGSGGTTLWTAEKLPLGVHVLPFNPVGWFETTAATALYADITAPGTNTHIAIVYVDVV